jgi:hypothetical protein
MFLLFAEKTARIKQARDEAEAEIKKLRQQMEAEFQDAQFKVTSYPNVHIMRSANVEFFPAQKYVRLFFV